MSLALAPVVQLALPARLVGWASALLGAQHGRFAPWLAVALGAGVLHYFNLMREPTARPLWLVPPLLGLAIWLASRRPVTGWAVALLAAFLLGHGAAAWHAARQPAPLVLPYGAVVVEGQVARVETLPEGQRITLSGARIDPAAEAFARHVRVRLRRDDPARPRPGDRLSVRALLREPGAPVVPGGYDFQRAAFFSGLGGSGFALGAAEVSPGADAALGTALARLRARLEATISAAIPGPAGAVATALVTGSKTAIPQPALVAMRDSGLAHLLAVSGLHMAIVMGLVFGGLRLALALLPWAALRLPGKALAALGALAAGAFYMLLTGSQVPMQRCLGMAALMTVALLTGRRALSLRVLAVAAGVVLLVAPAEVLGPSFQMSFSAVLALIAGHDAARPWLARLVPKREWRGRAVLFVVALMLTSALAGAATAPAGWHHFGRLQAFGILANALAVPLTSLLVMPAALLAVLALPLGLQDWPLWAMGWGVRGILEVAGHVAGWPGAAPAMVPLPGWGLALGSLGFCWFCLWRGWLRAWGVPLIVLGLGAGWVSPPPDLLVSGDARVVALSTGQGVFLHRMPGARSFVVDNMLRALGATEAQTLPVEGMAAGGALACTPGACRFRPDLDRPAAALLRSPPSRRGERAPPANPGAACGEVALLVALEPIAPRCGTAEAIDRFAMWRDGAQAAWLTPAGAVLRSDRGWRGERPWVPPEPLPGRAETLPMAPIDPG